MIKSYCIRSVRVEGTELIGEDAGETDVESAVKQVCNVIPKEIVKHTDSLDSDKLKRPKRKRKKYVNRRLSRVLRVFKLHV